MKNNLWAALFSALLLTLLSPTQSVLSAAERPNFVFILVDDLGRQDLGCEGSEFYETPHIDELANSAMRFENAYSSCQVCSPSRAAIQTGKTPARLHITDYINPGGANQPEKWSRNTRLLPASYEPQLALEETTIAEALKPLGYHSFFAGKWHLGGEGFLPTDQGYDINVAGHQYGTPPGGFFAPYRNPALEDGPPGEHLPLRLGRETADYIRRHASADTPFFAMLSFYSVHAPIQSTEELWRKYQQKAEAIGIPVERSRFLFDRTQEVRQVQDNPLYAGMMEAMDEAVGMVLTALKESGQAENTVVIFTSDNGGVSSGDGYATACLPFRGGKGRQWEGGIRQPLYIRAPGYEGGGSTAAFANGIDFFPTILELAGAEEDSSQLDGGSLAPALRGEAVPARLLFWHYPHYGNQGGEPSSIVRDGDWKLIHYYEDGRNELYNLREDIGEVRDLAEQQPERVEQMWLALNAWLQEVGAKFPTMNSEFDERAYEQSLQQARQVRMPNREREHAALLHSDYSPNGGWWQDKARR